ncbi:leucyl aminopeptidase [Alphaproteobacteria bacterium]|nr:leucyl aminopeptidase [Alphaproteobacteria bacterium]
MRITTEFCAQAPEKDQGVAFVLFEDNLLCDAVKTLDLQHNGLLSQLMERENFKGKVAQTLSTTLEKGSLAVRVFLVGMGKKSDSTLVKAQEAGGRLFPFVKSHRIETLSLLADESALSFPADHLVAHVAHGFKLRSWAFDKYRTVKKDENAVCDLKIHAVTAHTESAQQLNETLDAVAAGVFTARELVSEPPNILYPESYANRVKEFKADGLKIDILNESQLKKLGMGALLGVGQGSEKASYLAVMHWNGGKKDEKPLAFVGKGVCFDTGGISLKPSRSMEDMKYDMGGSAAVCGLMRTLALRKAKVNAVGIIGLVENMPSGNAIRPSDVLTSMSGKTIEVLNTDAEGRLVLADAIHYAKDKYDPKLIIDLATLTGAIVVSLADVYTGLFSNNDTISKQLSQSGIETGERVWRLPMDPAYDRMINSPVADVANMVTLGSGAGSITAAHFLKRFVGDTPWAHLDIAGTASIKGNKPLSAKGATGVGVRLLNKMVENFYEDA